MNGQLGKRYLEDYLKKSDPLFEEYLEEKIGEAAKISRIPAELLKRFLATARRGKKIRGSLVTLGYRAAGGRDQAAALEAGLAIELFHAALLVHDDIMDRDDRRRGRPALHRQFEAIGRNLGLKANSAHYGESMAGCLIDAAFYLSWEKLLGARFSPPRLVKAGQIYARFAVRTAWGQSLDIATTSTKDLNQKDVLKVLRYKSAEYTGVLPLLFGATLAGLDDQKRIQAIKNYGLAMGWAFQIQDDILGMFGDEKKLGKPIGSDLREGKNTLLMLHLLQHGRPSDQAFMHRVLGNKKITLPDVVKTRRILKQTGSYQHVIDLGWKHVAEGKKHVPKITKNKKIQAILESLIVYMMERTK